MQKISTMKVVAYSVKPFEKACLAKANNKKHDITLISNSLSTETAFYAEGKEAVIVFTNDDVSEKVIDILAGFGIKYIATRSVGMDHIDNAAAAKHGIKIANVPNYSPQAIAEHTIALALALSRPLVVSDRHSREFNFKMDQLVGFNFFGKTIGLIGLDEVGLAVAKIFNGFGCKVLAFDVPVAENMENIYPVSLEGLYANADIISLHIPLTNGTKFMINSASIAKMKKGVMLINTSSGGLMKTTDIFDALKTGQIGYLGLDAYEFEKGLFFEDHRTDLVKEKLLKELLALPNVLITPHQAFLTGEAIQQIAEQTIRALDTWQEESKALTLRIAG
ncbi:MAG: 2-hydroxyacid dehydrogenase [Bacteroidota bacterium]|nr:2-hydroxyacid dehydrogenase [Bacteroidota bacterium]